MIANKYAKVARVGWMRMSVQKLAAGQQVHLALVERGEVDARSVADSLGQPDLFERVTAVASEAPAPNFLHSALCAMSLPVRRPKDENAAIIRQDGAYTLVINPKPVVTSVDEGSRLKVLGVPFGSLPRLILIHIMTEAVRTQSRNIVLGKTFTEWMRRLGYSNVSYGPRGTATLIKEQLDRLLACEWMIRWDSTDVQGEREFAIKEIKLTNNYHGLDQKNGSFLREIMMTEGFFGHLCEHAVPLNEHAIRQLRDSATALDLYTWLAYRLPRISGRKPALLSWNQVATHFGNDGKNMRKFRQTVREAWDRHVSAVYPEARCDFGTSAVRLHSSPAPMQKKLVKGFLAVSSTDADGTPSRVDPLPALDINARFLAALRAHLGPQVARAWLDGAEAEAGNDHLTLRLPTRFKADYVRQNFDAQIRHAATISGHPGTPLVEAKP